MGGAWRGHSQEGLGTIQNWGQVQLDCWRSRREVKVQTHDGWAWHRTGTLTGGGG